MREECEKSDELSSLADGELTERRAASLREHLRGCAACQRAFQAQRDVIEALAAPAAAVDATAAVARLMARLEADERRAVTTPAPSARRRGAPFLAGALATAALAATIAIASLGGLSHRADEQGVFRARGGHDAPSLRRSVGVTLRPFGDGGLGALAGEVDAETTYVATYRNLSPDQPAYLLAFAVDAAGEVHWLYPAYERAGQDPEALPLPYAPIERALPTSVRLDAPAPGPLRFITLIAAEPLRVSALESLTPADLGADALRRRWPGASIDEKRVTLGARAGAGGGR